jgi:acyl carrier protein
VELVGFDNNEFEPSSCLGSPELNFDELDIVEFIMMLEEEFNIEISDEDSEKYFKFESQVKDIADYIDAKIHGIVPSPEDVAEAKSLVEFIQTHPMSEPPVQFVTPQQAVQKDLDDYNRGYEVGYKKGIKDGIAHSWRAHNESEINSSNFKRKNSYNQGFVVGYNKGYRCGRSDYKHK